MAKPRVAIIGSGIAGLGCAHFLHQSVELTVYEAAAHVGGHANTVRLPSPQDKTDYLPVDTGFMVFNRVTYPLLCRLFDELGVPSQASDMSFSVQYQPDQLEWAGAGWNQLFGQRRNFFNPDYWHFLLELNRFNKTATAQIDDAQLSTLSLGQYVERHQFSETFVEQYLLPMSSAIWSTAPDRMLEFPARTLIRFFRNHGFLGMDTHYQWYTVTGGSETYVRQLTAPWRDRIRLNTPIKSISKLLDDGWVVETVTGETTLYDQVIVATHADQALALLAEPTPLQREILGCFGYSHNRAVLHHDASVMPKRKRVWSAWNYRLRSQTNNQSNLIPGTHYWMNRLQSLPTTQPVIVSINDVDTVDPATIAYQTPYDHPQFTLEAIEAQKRLPSLNRSPETKGLYFVGSYWRYGFHEDALGSAVLLTRQLMGEQHPWADWTDPVLPV